MARFTIDPQKPATWKRSHGYNSTKDSYEFLARLKKYNAQASGLRITITGESGDKGWIELNTSDQKRVAPELVEECLEALRQVQKSGQVQLAAQALHFDDGTGPAGLGRGRQADAGCRRGGTIGAMSRTDTIYRVRP